METLEFSSPVPIASLIVIIQPFWVTYVLGMAKPERLNINTKTMDTKENSATEHPEKKHLSIHDQHPP